MKSVFIDTNILVDILQDRLPFSQSAVIILDQIANQELKGYIAAITVNLLYYIGKKTHSKQTLARFISRINQVLVIAPVTNRIISLALDSPFSDFEDAIQHQSALQSQCDYIITRNPKDYKHSQIPILTPSQLLQQ